MRTLIACGFMLPALHAFGASEQYVLRTQGINCPAKYKKAIEEIADARDEQALERAVGAAFASGKCINSYIEVPMLVDKVSREKSSRGSLYYCYVRRGEKERFCSDEPSIATIAQIKAERTGDYEVVADNEKLLAVKCVEGGRVFVEKGAKWLRRSSVFFSDEEPTEHTVSPDKERAARDGCRGLDF